MPERSIGIVAALLLLTVHAAGAQEIYVPPELEAWVPWVLEGEEHRVCPFVFNRPPGGAGQHRCAWPGPLTLDVQAPSAAFAQSWRVYRDGWVVLPGDASHWPEVRSGDRPLRVLLRGGRPMAWLPQGVHQLIGRIPWVEAPASLAIPPSTGIVRLSVTGRTIDRPERRDGTLWLRGSRPASAPSAPTDRLTLNVYRRIADGIPMRQTVQIQLEVSGASREALLGRVLPPGWLPVSLEASLPARVEQDGRLRVQLRPGSWVLSLQARAAIAPQEIRFDAGEGEWASEEVWSYASDDRLRVTAASAPTPVDPAQARVPAQWRELPAFRLMAGDALRLEERSRGLAETLENQLHLEREMWRDFDGRGYTVRDRIQGRMLTGWRLDMVSPFRLASAREGGGDLLVTRGAGDGLTGVELRSPDLSLESIARMDDPPGELPASGWRQRFDAQQLVLHLPAGERLLGALGADEAHGAWLGRWRLLDYFLVLLIAIAVGRLASPALAVVALAMLVLTYFEPGAPRWVWLSLLAGIALARHAPEGRLRQVARWFRNLAFLALIILVVPFAAAQLRNAVYPQLESGAWTRPGSAVVADNARRSKATMAMPAPVAESPVSRNSDRERSFGPQDTAIVEEMVVAGSLAPRPAQRAPDVLVQTGPPVPRWSRQRYRIDWRGPVTPDQTVRLVILGRQAYRAIRVLGVALMGLLIGSLIVRTFGTPRWPAGRGPASAWFGMALALLTLMLPSPAPLLADTPDPAILRELGERLRAVPECSPRCAELATASVAVTPDRVEMTVAVHAQERVLVPLPGSLDSWSPASVRVDGARRDWLYRDAQGAVWVALEPGIHSIVVTGPLSANADAVVIPFPEPPRRVSARAEGWRVSGVVDGRLPGGALQLRRVRSEEGKPDEIRGLEPGDYPPFVQVTRSLQFQLDWRVRTAVTRIAPARAPFTMQVPLLPGEAVTSSGIEVVDGKVVASFAAGQQMLAWESQLERADSLRLQAAASDAPYREVWRLVVGELWRVGFDGTPVIGTPAGARRWTPEFHPRPGESVMLTAVRPEGLDGATLTFDAANLHGALGKRGSEWMLRLDYRSTRGAPHPIRLPPSARVVEVTLDGSQISARPVDGTLMLPVRPGEHQVRIRWESPEGAGLWSATPAVDLGTQAGNVTLALDLAGARWVLATRGPALGPAVLFWGELLVLLLLAPALARLPGVPLATYQWILLGLGFGTFSWPTLALLAGWLFAMGWRGHSAGSPVRWRYNLTQTMLFALSIATLGALISVIPQALLGTPDLHVVGNGSSGSQLRWFVDRSDGLLPGGSALSLPLWSYKVAILAWVLWFSFALLQWLAWAWRAWSRNGIWRGRVVSATPLSEQDDDGERNERA